MAVFRDTTTRIEEDCITKQREMLIGSKRFCITSVFPAESCATPTEKLLACIDAELEKAFDWGASDIKPTLPQELSGPAPTVDSYNFGQAPANAPMADPNAPTLADLMREINALKQQVEAQKVASVSKTGAGRFAPRSHVNKTRISRV